MKGIVRNLTGVLVIEEKGGPGSGHRGHAGRPGKRGGSSPGTSGGLATRAQAQSVASTDSDAIIDASREIGIEYFGEPDKYGGLSWYDPRDAGEDVVVGSMTDRLRDQFGSIEEGREALEAGEAQLVDDLVDDYEYMFVWDSSSKTARPWDTYLKKTEAVDIQDVESFYSGAKSDEYLVSVWETIEVVVP